MSTEELKPGDVVKEKRMTNVFGMVMRSDPFQNDSLIAFPGHDELIVMDNDELQYIGTIETLCEGH